MPSALDLAVLTILRPHFRIQGGASLVSAEGLEALATLSPRDEAGQRRVQTMLRRKVMAQHVDRPGWLHVFPVVPSALATLRIASSQIDMAWIEREMRSSLVIDVEEWSMEPQGEMRDDEREVLFLSSGDDGESCPQSKRQRSEGSRYFADKMKIHRLNHKLSCMVRAKTDDLELRLNFFKGPRLHYHSLRGAFPLVLRRLIANVGARAIVASLQIDLHRTTVNMWEIYLPRLLGELVAQVARTNAPGHECTPGWRLRREHVARGDATNSRQTAKIHSMEIKSMFLKLDVVHESHEKSANESQKYLDSIETRTAMCNLFEMKGGSAMDTHALYLKHVAPIGCPDWNVCTFAPAGTTICITFFLGSDGGPDEVGAKMQAMYESILDPPSVARFVFSNQCLLHIYHLIFKKSLSTGDTVCRTLRKFQTADRRYFSSMVNILHTWRDTSKKMKHVWTAKYGQQAASQVCTGRVPIAMSGRWCATSKGEEFLLRAVSNSERSQQFRQVCSVVWTSAKNPQAKAGVATKEEKWERLCDGHVDDGDGLTELAVEAMDAETVKRCKWRASSLQAVKDETFIDIIVAMLHRSREPLRHFMHWIEQTAKPTEIDGEQRYTGKMALLCWSKAKAFFLSELVTDFGVWRSFLLRVGRERALCFERMHPLGYSPTPWRLQLAGRHHDSLGAL